MFPLILTSTYVVGALTVFFYMTAWFIVSVKKQRNDLADVAWGPGFVLAMWVSLIWNQAFTLGPVLVAILITLWGVRLSWHIHKRNHGKTEDFRYKAWREAWGRWFYLRSFFQVFMLQGALLLLVITPGFLVSSMDMRTSIDVWMIVGSSLFFLGFFFEAVGDRQLSIFLSQQNHGPVMKTGLWAYTRHPNYFGEVTLWWGIFVIALGAPLGWVSIVGPITITVLILGISGIPMLEKKYIGNSDYEEYKKTTSAFFPLPPKK
jgi:steroid 5-alpha reductase family enzyme